MARLNPTLPTQVFDDPFRKVTGPKRPALEARNRALHRLLIDGVIMEDRHSEARRGSGLDATARQAISFGGSGGWEAMRRAKRSEAAQGRAR